MNFVRNFFFSALLLIFGFGGATLAQSALKSHDTKQPIDISASRLEVQPKQGRAVFAGAVKVVQGDLLIGAEKMTVFYDTKGKSEDPSISRLDATGNVTLTSKSEKVSGEWAIYDVERKLVTLGGKVVLIRGDTELKGERLELDLVTGLTKLDGAASGDGRVKGRFTIPKDKKDHEG